jgi:hypothetical protein
MPRNNSEEERLTEDEIARRKLGPRSVPGGEDPTKMTPQQEKNIPKKGDCGISSAAQSEKLTGLRDQPAHSAAP